MPPAVRIRNAEAGDLAAVFAIRAAARRAAYHSFLSGNSWRSFEIQNAVTSWNLAAWQERAERYLAEDRYIFRVAVHNNRVAGWLLADVREHEVHIMRLFVDPEKQGTGVGGQLLADLFEHKLHTTLTLTVLKPNVTAIAFYEKHGFRVLGEAHYRFLGVPCIRMVRTA